MGARGSLRRRWPGRRLAALAIAAALWCAALLGAGAVYAVADPKVGPDEYDIGAWEVRNFPAKWLYLVGEAFRAGRSPDQQDADLRRFLELTREIEDLERRQDVTAGDDGAASLEPKRRERDRLENRVEATVEARLTAAASDLGVTRSFFGRQVVWPPVDFEFTEPPRTLAESPRDRIELKDATLLRPDLSPSEVEAIEADKLRRENLSALTFPTSGIGTYPTIVEYEDDYEALLKLAGHEWTHNYLAFRPLGLRYYKNADLRTMNETVADLVGKELAEAVLARGPLETPQPPETAPPPSFLRVDVAAELRHLRGDVDTLLAQGKVDEAESLMEARRLELAEKGAYIRKINQAYFAFTNLYAGEAGNPAATNPIGPKIDALRARSGSLREFLRVVGGMTSAADLDAALAAPASR